MKTRLDEAVERYKLTAKNEKVYQAIIGEIRTRYFAVLGGGGYHDIRETILYLMKTMEISQKYLRWTGFVWGLAWGCLLTLLFTR